MEIDGVPYYARNGKHSDTSGGLISGKYWSEQAETLFWKLGSYKDNSYCQHVETQLMTYYLSRWLNKYGSDIRKFCAGIRVPKIPGAQIPGTDPVQIDIFVSRTVCRTCTYHVDLMNEMSKEYGFVFKVEARMVHVKAAS